MATLDRREPAVQQLQFVLSSHKSGHAPSQLETGALAPRETERFPRSTWRERQIFQMPSPLEKGRSAVTDDDGVIPGTGEKFFQALARLSFGIHIDERGVPALSHQEPGGVD